MKKRIAINGFGRIGRMVLRVLMEHHSDSIEVVAINDLASLTDIAHLFEFDSTYGRWKGSVDCTENTLRINDSSIHVYSKKDPENLPWKDLEIDTVLECTGVFRTREGMQKHITAGAKKVLLSAPAKGDIDGTFVVGVNEDTYNPKTHILVSNASCTTNCLAPVAKVLHTSFGIISGLMTTIHSYTGDQRILDSPHKDLRRARSAGQNIIPTTTGAAKAVALVLPELKGKLNGMAFRIPTATVSVVDLVVQLEKKASAKEVNKALCSASLNELQGILGYEEKPLVSKDFLQESRSSIVDASLTQDMGNGLVKIVAWYDNEWGYSCRLADMVCKM